MPSALVALGDYLIVADAEAPFLRAFNGLNGEAVGLAGPLGDGPGEFRVITYLSTYTASQQSGVLAFDVRQQRVSRWLVDAQGVRQAGQPLRLSGEEAPSIVASLDRERMIGLGAFTPNVYSILDDSGAGVTRAGTLPFVDKTISPAFAQQVISGRPAIRPSGDRIAIVARYAGRIDIYDLRTGTQSIADVPISFTPELRARSNGAMAVFVTDGQTQFGYLDATASECCIYALFSGRTRSGFPGRASVGNIIHVFDWNGRFLREHVVSEDLALVAMAPDGRSMFGLTLEPEPAIMRYALRD